MKKNSHFLLSYQLGYLKKFYFFRYFKEMNRKDLLISAFNSCLILKWIEIEFESKKDSLAVKKFQIIDNDFVTIYDYIRTQNERNLLFETSLDSDHDELAHSSASPIVDETLLVDGEEDSVSLKSIFENLKLEEKFSKANTPIYQRLRRKKNI